MKGYSARLNPVYVGVCGCRVGVGVRQAEEGVGYRLTPESVRVRCVCGECVLYVCCVCLREDGRSTGSSVCAGSLRMAGDGILVE